MNLISYSADDAVFYGNFYPLLRDAIDRICAFVTDYSDSCRAEGKRDPVEHITSRIKSAQSMKAKLKRRGIEVSPENSLTAVHDSVGVRVVCTYIGDVYVMAGKLREWKDINISCEKDYIKHPKSNGYRSYHIVCSIVENGVEIAAEIQLRTIVMDCWASLEHQIKYKKTIPNQEEIEKTLKMTANDFSSADEKLEKTRLLIDSGASPLTE